MANIIINKDVDNKIKELCLHVNNIEWSGVLFYKLDFDGNLDTLQATCIDILPLNIGSTGYTEYKYDASVANYMAMKPELFDCALGLIHSHHNMNSFFSGVDTKTLFDEGKDLTHFLSLIVNNKGEYVAKITYKTKPIQSQLLTFNDVNYIIEKSDAEWEVKALDLTIVKEEEDDLFISKLMELKKSKAVSAVGNYVPKASLGVAAPKGVVTSNAAKPLEFKPDKNFKDPYALESDDLFDDIDVLEDPYNYQLKPSNSKESKELYDFAANEILAQVVTLNIPVINIANFDLKVYIPKMDSIIEKRFGKDYNTYISIASALYDILETYYAEDLNVRDAGVRDAFIELVDEYAAEFPESKTLKALLDEFII